MLEELLKNPKDSKKFVKNLQLFNNQVDEINFIPQDFKNLEVINLTMNLLQDVEALSNFKKLASIYLGENKIKAIPIPLCNIPLILININKNQIKELPQ